MIKKGFTLIELLAVIVILAIIALIATPIVLDIIENSKKSAAEASARNIVDAARLYYIQNLTENTKIIDLAKENLDYDGEKPKKGYVKYDEDGNIIISKMYLNEYCIEIKNSNDIVTTKVAEDKCEITDIDDSKEEPIPEPKEEIIISNKEEFKNLISTINTKNTKNIIIKLKNKIDMTDEIISDSIGSLSKPFLGEFDGQNNTITIAISNTNDYVGLFGYIGSSGIVKNLIIDNSTIQGNNYVGTIAGYNEGTIENVVINDTTITGNDYVGGVVGYGGKINILELNQSSISGNSYVGGIAGDNVIANDCTLNMNNVDATSNYGLVVGKIGKLTNILVDGETITN